MRKLLISIAIVAISATLHAQDRFLNYFLQRADTSAVSFGFTNNSVNASGAVLDDMTGAGVAQKGAFMLSAGTRTLYADGRKRWTLDSSSKEAVSQVIPKGSEPDLLTDPVQFLFNVRAALKEEFAGTARFRGRPAHAIFFESGNLPGVGPSSKVKIYMREGVLFAVTVEDGKGNVTEVSFSNMTLSRRKPLAEFSPDLKALGSDWVVTELSN